MKGLVCTMEYGRLKRKGREKYLDKVVLNRRGYTRHGLLGQGTFSDVYCVEGADGRMYACKVCEQAEMLEREAKAMEGLSHPLFPKCVDFWTEGKLGILLREYVAGSCLKEMLERRHFSMRQTIRAGIQLAEGLGYLHGLPERLLFRDVKPANIIIRQDGGVMLIDFGCVCSMAEKVTSRAGSPGFAAPEQLRKGGMLTASCDVYGLGRTLMAMLGTAQGCPYCGYGREHWTDLLEERLHRSRVGTEEAKAGISRRGQTSLQKAGERRETWQERQARKKLLCVLEACTEEKIENRIANMDEVIRELMGILDILSGYPGMPDPRGRYGAGI